MLSSLGAAWMMAVQQMLVLNHVCMHARGAGWLAGWMGELSFSDFRNFEKSPPVRCHLSNTVTEIKDSGDGWSSLLGSAEEEISKLKENVENHAWWVKKKINIEEKVRDIKIRCNTTQLKSQKRKRVNGEEGIFGEIKTENYSKLFKGHQITY